MIPKIIHQVWLGPAMPAQLVAWRKAAMAQHPGWLFVLWTDGRVLIDDALRERCDTLSAESNCVRLGAVLLHGGIYLDCDVECLKPLDPLLEHQAFAAVGTPKNSLLCTGIFGAEPGHQWVRWQVERLPEWVCKDSPWGSRLMSEAPRDGLTILDTELLYPWYYGESPRPAPNSYTIHHWQRNWGIKGQIKPVS